MNYVVTGDTHGKNLERIQRTELGEGDALIILGDAGFNFYLNKTDEKNKQKVQDTGCIVYCVRGNHEERPENIEGMEVWADEEIGGYVYRQPQYPNIRYLMDGHTYFFNGHPTLVIGGAYSVDKYYRLSRYHNGESHFLGWFPQEQLSVDEMKTIEAGNQGWHYDFVLSHTCPRSWEPTDLFLNSVDQSTVDKTMEDWLEGFKDKIKYNVWLFGHYHDDRLVRPHVEMYYYDTENLEDIYKRWTIDQEIPWWLKKDPNYNK